MGLTLIRKGDGVPKRNPKIALVLAGGAVSGGAFKVGGLKALDDFLVARRVVDFDMYIGLSAGAVLAVPLAAGIPPNEMVKVLEGSSDQFDQLRPIDFYTPNWREFIGRPAKFSYDLLSYLPGVAAEFVHRLPSLPGALDGAASEMLRHPSYTHFEALALRVIEHVSPQREIPALSNHIPSGLFDNKRLEVWLRENLEPTLPLPTPGRRQWTRFVSDLDIHQAPGRRATPKMADSRDCIGGAAATIRC